MCESRAQHFVKYAYVLQRVLAVYAHALQSLLTGMLVYRQKRAVHAMCLVADSLLLGVMMVMSMGWREWDMDEVQHGTNQIERK